MSSLKIGLASVTFRNKTIEEVVEIAKSNGISYIEWGADVHVKNIEDAKKALKICRDSGVKISSYGSYYRVGSNKTEEWKNICRIASEMSASSIRVWLGTKNSEDTDEKEYKNLLKDAKEMCDIASEYNLNISAECHDNTFNNNTYAFLKFKEDLQKDNFTTYFQSRYKRKEYDLDRIEKTFTFTENVHVSYRDLFKEQLSGKRDRKYIDMIIDKLLKMNFDGIVMIEFTFFSKEKYLKKDVKRLKNF